MRTNLTWIILGGLIGLAAIGVLIFALNRFGNLGLFSAKTPVISIPSKTSQNSQSSKIILPCPIEQKPCPVGEAIEPSVQNSQFIGAGYNNLASGVKVRSVNAGQIQMQTEADTKKVTISIVSPEQNLQINYSFKGVPVGSKTSVNANEVIGSLAGEVLGKKVLGKDYSLVVSVLDLETREYIKITSTPEGLEIKP